MIKFEKRKKTTSILCTNIIILFILCFIIVSINFYTKKTITKERIGGINPVSSVSIAMREHEPLIITLEKEEKPVQESEKKESNLPNIEQSKIEQKTEEQKNIEIDVNVRPEEVITNNTLEEKIETPILTEYQGFTAIGKIEIPKTHVNLPILKQVTVEGMKCAPCLLYETGELNQNGNNLIVGHNFRDNTLFSNNKKLNLGDKIYITTLDGNTIEYTIYNKFITTPEDVSYIKRDTNNKPEITLSCCTDDDEERIIILAKM